MLKMIGILCNDGEKESIQEFFELFKTPWEFFESEQTYQVVISTLSEIPHVNARLVVVYSSQPTQFDGATQISVDSLESERLIDCLGLDLPIYGNLSSLHGAARPLLHSKSGSEPVAIGFSTPDEEILRVGYDLFQEVAFLLSQGQSVDNARVPALECHISLLREWILNAGIPLVEIPPIPWGHNFIACLTHDVDFAGIRHHKFDHTFWGFVYRALLGSVAQVVQGRGSLAHLLQNWKAVFSLPFVYLGLVEDFWDQFHRYPDIDQNFSSTFFLIPFKHRVGDKVQAKFPARRATHYDVEDVGKQVQNLIHRGCEIGLHGIDAWHSVEKGQQELNRIVEATGQNSVGVRIHWLCFDRGSPAVLEQAGFDYDATVGYNEMIGYRAGTTQVFRPFGATRLLELPLHIQDTALFNPRRLGLTNTQAWELCETLLNTAVRFGGVLTVLWHERSLAPERLWGEFYKHLLEELDARGAWFGTAGQVVQWFRARRSVVFEEYGFTANTVRLRLKYESSDFEPRMFLRVHRPRKAESVESHAGHSYIDLLYAGESLVEIPLD